LVQDRIYPEYNFRLNIYLPRWNSCYHPIRDVGYLPFKTVYCHPSAVVSSRFSGETGNNGDIIPG